MSLKNNRYLIAALGILALGASVNALAVGGNNQAATVYNVEYYLTAPTHVQAENMINTQMKQPRILLTWTDTTTKEQRFEIYRRQGVEDYQLLTLMPENTQAFYDTAVQPGVVYQYKIRAVNYDTKQAFSEFSPPTKPLEAGEKDDSY